MIKAAFFVTTLHSGGIENYLLRFLRHFEGKIEPYVYSKSGRAGQLDKQYSDAGAQLRPLKLSFFNFNAYKELERELERHRFDAVCDFTGNFAGLVLRAAHKAKVKKRVAFYRGATHHFQKDLLRLAYDRWQNRLVKKYATDILFNSFAAQKFFFGAKPERGPHMEVIYNGLDVDKFRSTKSNLRQGLGIPETAFVVGHVGRYTEAKNHKTIIEVAKRLCQEHPDIHFIMCGNGVVERFKDEIGLAGLVRQIHILTNQEQVIKVYNTLDCFYFPSLTEGQPNALIEAMACNIPFVASNIESIQETVPEYERNQLIPPDDINLAITRILDFKNKLKKNSSLFNNDLQSFVRKNYNPEKLFNNFYNKL